MQAYPYPINMYNSGSGGLSPAIPSFDPPPNPWETQQAYGLKYDAITTKKLIAQYKMAPRSFNKEQVGIIKRHASSYNIPFAEDEQTFLDYVGGTVSQIVTGYLSGFTTLNLGPAPQTGIESVARAIGSVAGFAGYLPGAPIKFAGKASGLKGIEDFGTALVAQSGKVKSVPMALTDMLLEKGKNLTDDIFKSASAVGKSTNTAMSMISDPRISNYLHRGIRMGLASGISSWQGGVDSMMKSFLWGATGGAADAFIGNVIKLPVKTQEMVIKGLAGSLVDGLPSTLRGDTTPEQVYYYIRGAYFGSQELPWEKRMAAENFSKWTKSNMSMDEFKKTSGMPNEALREFDVMTEQYLSNPMTQYGIAEMLKSLGITEESMSESSLREKIDSDIERSTGKPEITNGGDPGQAPTNSIELPHKKIVSIAKEFLHPFVDKTSPNLFDAKNSITKDLSRKHYEVLDQVKKFGGSRNAYTETMLKYIKDSYYPKTEMPKELEGKLNAIARLEEQNYVSTHWLFNLSGTQGFGDNFDAKDIKLTVANADSPYSPTGKRIASKQMRTDMDRIVELSTNLPIVYADTIYTSSDNGRVSEIDLIDIHGSKAYKKIIDQAWESGYYWNTGINASVKEVFVPLHPFVKGMNEPQIKAVLDDLLVSMADSKFKKGIEDVYKDINTDTKKYSREQQMKIIVSNMIYETSKQYKFAESLDDVKAFFKWSNGANIVDTEKKRNKREQVVYTTGSRMSQEAFREEDFAGKEDYYKRTNGMAAIREVFIEDASGKFTGENRIPANSDPGLVETSTDGATITHPSVLKVSARWAGLDEQAGEMKVVGVHLDPENTGLKLIKTALHNAGSKEMYELMEKHGITHITYITAAKQTGKAKPIKYADLFKDDISEHIVTRPWESQIINTGKNINAHHAMGKQTMVKQFFTQLNPLLLPEEERGFVTDSLSTMLKASISDVKNGDKKYNDMVAKFLASNDIEERILLRKEIVDNIDDVNKSLIYSLLSDKKAGSASADLLLKLLDKEREEIKRDVDEGDLTESDAARMLDNVDKESSALEYFLTNMRDRPESILRNPNTRDMALKTIKSYITRSIVRPKIANSGEFVVDPYISDAHPKGSAMAQIRDDPNRANIFMLGHGAREMQLRLQNGKSISLGKLWDFVQAAREAGEKVPDEYNELLRFVVLRTPQGSPSGARVLQFAGFDDNEGHLGIYTHPDAFSHLGGADTDIDVFKIYTGSMTTDASGKIIGSGFSKELKDSVDKFKHFAYEGGAPKDVDQPKQVLHGVTRIISGGQSGGDIGGVNAAIKLGLDYGGTMPKGFRSELTGVDFAKQYNMKEHASADFPPRTMQNVDDADATIAFLWGDSVGTKKTIGYARTGKWGYDKNETSYSGYKPVLVVTTKDVDEASKQILEFVIKSKAKTINIAGHREKSQKGIQQFVEDSVVKALSKQDTAGITKQQEQPIVTVKDYSRYGDAQAAQNDPNMVYTLRQGKKIEQYGNPFSSGKGGYLTIKMGGVKESVDAYIKWLKDPDATFTDVDGKVHRNVRQEQRKWILEQIDSGALDGKTLAYYKQKDVEGGKYYSHADALADFINKRRGSAKQQEQPVLQDDNIYNIDQKEQIDPKTGKLYTDAWVKKDPYAESFKKPALMFNPNVRMAVQEANLSGRKVLGQVANMQTNIRELSNILHKNNGKLTFTEEAPDGSKLTYEYTLKDRESQIDAMRAAAAALNMTADITEYDGIKDPIYILKDVYDRAFDITVTGSYYDLEQSVEKRDTIKYRGGAIKRIAQTKNAAFDKNRALDRAYTDEEVQHMLQKSGDVFNGVDDTLLAVARAELLGLKTKVKAIDEDNIQGIVKAYEDYDKANGDIKHVFRRGSTSVKRNKYVDMFIDSKLYDEAHKLYAIHDVGNKYWTDDVYRNVAEALGYKIYSEDQIKRTEGRENEYKATGKGKPPYISSKQMKDANAYVERQAKFNIDFRTDLINEYARRAEPYILRDMHDIVSYKIVEEIYNRLPDSYPKSQVQKRVLEKVVDLFKYRIAEYAEVKEDNNKSMSAAKISLDEKYLEIKNSLELPIEQELFDAFIMSSMSYGGKGSREKNPDMKARFENWGFFKGTSDTSINRMSIQLRSIPKEMFNRFNSVYDEVVLGKATVEDIGELYSGSKKLYTDNLDNDAAAWREIRKLQASLESPGELIHTPSITQAEIRDSIDKIIPSRIDSKLLDKYLTTPELQKRYESEYRPVFDEFRKNIESTGYTDIESINQVVRGMTGRAIDVANIGKDINALTLADIKTINTMFSELKRPSTAIKLFGGKNINNPIIRKAYYYLFPSEAGRDRQRFVLRFKDDAGYWVNKYGRAFEGTVKVPVNDIEQIAKHLHDADEFSKKAFENSMIGFNNPLNRYTSLPDYKELSTIAIELREGKKYIATLMKRDDIPADRKKQLIDEYTASRKRALVSLREISQKTPLMEIKYRGANGEDVVEKKTPYSIVVDINNVMTNHLKGIYENLISAKPEAIYRFAKTKNGKPVFYYDYENKKYSNLPIIDRKKFYEYIDAHVREGKGIPVDFGIDGLRLIQHSMLYDDMYGFGRPATDMHKKAATNMLMMASEDNGKIKTHAYEYDIYFPHIFSNREAYRKDMQAELSMIDKDNTLAPETKTRLKERLLKDYFRYGTNLQDELEHDTFLRNHDLIRETIESIKDKRQRESEELKYLSSMSKAGNQMSRSSFNLGYEKSLDSIERYTESIIKTYYRNMSQMLVRREIGKSRALNTKMFGEKAASDWAKFQHLYAQAAAGYGVVIPDSFRDNPDLKIKGTLFDAYSDSNVHKIVNNLAAKFGIAKEKANIFGEVVSHAEIAAFSALEAKYAMASLLARPKNMFSNMIGGELNNGISAGFNTLIRAQKVDDFRDIHKDWDSIDKVRSTFTKWGIIEDMLVNELDNAKWAKNTNIKNFITDLSKKLTKDPDMSDKSVADLARQYNVADIAFNSAAWFMRTAERKLRLDSAMVHYLHAVDNMRPVIGSNVQTIIKYDSPILIEAAKQGIKATQFLYSAPFRPMFSASSLGKIMTRFQMYAFNSVDFRKNVFQKAKYVGYREGSPEFERMKRLMAADMISLAASSAFMYSVFDNNLPAPWNWVQDLSNWLFGDKKERDRAFFGVYPSAVAPLQMFTPPSLRLVGPTISGLVENDFSRIAEYTIWTMFPFGPLTMDIKNSIENPNMMIEKMTGLPYHAVAEVIKTKYNSKTGQKIVEEDNEPNEGIEASKNMSNVIRPPM